MDINVIIANGNAKVQDRVDLYGDEPVVHIADPDITMTDLVCHLGLYKSKSMARKAGRQGPLPTGWNVFKGNKKTFIYLWNPTE